MMSAEHGVLVADVDVGRIGKAAESFRRFLILREELHDFRRLRERGRLEKHRVEQAEDGGIGANPEGEHGDGGDAEAARLQQLTESEPEVVEHNINGVMPLAAAFGFRKLRGGLPAIEESPTPPVIPSRADGRGISHSLCRLRSLG